MEGRAWYYESRRGISLYTQKRDKNGTFISGDVTNIPWGKLMRSARRCGWVVKDRRTVRRSVSKKEAR